MKHLRTHALRLCITAGLGLSLLVTGSPVQAQQAKPTAAVALGDSFVSGEGAGNYEAVVDINGVAQGYQDFSAPNSNAYFCHRSANAEIEVAALAGIDARFNLACSGGLPGDIANPSMNRDHGRSVTAQIEQLREVAKTHDIDLVIVGLGANSIGFGDVAQRCIGNFMTDAFVGWWEAWVNIWSPHSTTKGACGAGDFPSAADVAAAQAEVEQASRLILQTLQEVDADGEHRVVFQDYVNPMPKEFDRKFHDERGRRDTRDKFRSLARERYAAGCPVHRSMLPLAHDMSERLGGMIGNVHDRMLREFPGADLVYLNVQRAFDGARLCETADSPANALHTPTRAVTNSDGHVQETLDGNKHAVKRLFDNCTDHFQRCQESWHPNAAGHSILGQCLSAAWGAPTTLVDCSRHSNGQIVTQMKSPSVAVSMSGRVHQSLGRRGEDILSISASYNSSLLDAPGLSIQSTDVTARAYNTFGISFAARHSSSGTYSYRIACEATTVHLAVTVRLTLTDGQVVTGQSAYVKNVSGCGGGDIPIE